MILKTALIISVLLLVGCTSYPRYRPDTDITPREQERETGNLTTKEYVEFGLILQSFLGRPYKGKSKYDDGLDCSEFTGEVFRKFDGTSLPRTSAEQYKIGKKTTVSRLGYGDLVFFRTVRDKISHVGIYVGHNKFIHASTARGVIISSLSEKYWAKRYAGGRRIIE